MPRETPHREFLAGGIDRRRIPRYFCSGVAQITGLPLKGALVRGRVRDLGLGGCCIECIEMPSWFELGDQTEILAEVNSWSFRAMAHVRTVRDRSRISVEFTRLSVGGQKMLADVIADLEMPRATSIRQGHLIERSRRLLESKSSLVSGSGSQPSSSIAIAGTIMPPQSEEKSSAAHPHAWFRDWYRSATSLDIFA